MPQNNFFNKLINSFKEAPFLVGTIFFLVAFLMYMLLTIVFADRQPIVPQAAIPDHPSIVAGEPLLPPTTIVSIHDLPLPAPTTTDPLPETQNWPTYIEVTDSCGVHFQGECVRVRSGPSLSYPVVNNVRTGVVLKTDGTKILADGHIWYHVVFDEWLSYPERLTTEWYVAGDFVREFRDEGLVELQKGQHVETDKHIVVDISDQLLYAYEGDTLVMVEEVSTGIPSSPTPIGNFTVFKKTPTRYMQGPLPGQTDYYDLPGVPWDLYFTSGGAVIHGAFWHESFGSLYSHGCVNLPVGIAEKVYKWADLGMPVKVQE